MHSDLRRSAYARWDRTGLLRRGLRLSANMTAINSQSCSGIADISNRSRARMSGASQLADLAMKIIGLNPRLRGSASTMRADHGAADNAGNTSIIIYTAQSSALATR